MVIKVMTIELSLRKMILKSRLSDRKNYKK